ncbi:MAG: response regulator transcription factor [Verrucomicrobiales bacterium]|nr:response regulator transcription factor [Verrucomicrobiales bacterium]
MHSNVIVVSEQPEARENLSKILVGWPDTSCKSFETGKEAVDYVRGHRVDVALVGLELPSMEGMQCMKHLRALSPQIHVVVLYSDDNSEQVFAALKAGASGFLKIRMDSRQLAEAIDEVRAGDVPISKEAARHLVRHFRPNHPMARRESLSSREEEIFDCLVQGYAAREIATKFALSYETVRSHLKHIYRKLGVRSRTEAVIKHFHQADEAMVAY